MTWNIEDLMNEVGWLISHTYYAIIHETMRKLSWAFSWNEAFVKGPVDSWAISDSFEGWTWMIATGVGPAYFHHSAGSTWAMTGSFSVYLWEFGLVFCTKQDGWSFPSSVVFWIWASTADYRYLAGWCAWILGQCFPSQTGGPVCPLLWCSWFMVCCWRCGARRRLWWSWCLCRWRCPSLRLGS